MSSAVVRVVSPDRQPLQLVITAALEVGREGDGLLLADDRVSRRHALLEAAGRGTLRITDLGSSNGVLVDGRAIDGAVVLEVGSSAFIGDTRIHVVERHVAPAATVRTTLAAAMSGVTAIERLAEEVSDMPAPGIVEDSDEPGTLTIMFSDIEESTEQTLAVGDIKWAEIMNHHTALMTRHVEARQGRVVRNLGDGFMMSFRSARQGVLAAIDMQRHLEKVAQRSEEFALRVRMGLHTGEVLQDDEGDLLGRHVQVAAQIGDLAAGGEILVSGLLKQITEPRGDIIFGEETEAELVGLDMPQIIHTVDWRTSLIQGSPSTA